MAETSYTTEEDLLRMQAEMQGREQQLAAAGYAPGEIPTEDEIVTEQVAEVDPSFVDPFAEFNDPFAEFTSDAPATNPLAQFPSEFPMEPGTSRASQELGEIFVPPMLGGDAPQIGPGRTTPETGGGVGSTLTEEQQAAMSAAAITMTDPQEIADMLKQFPEIGITYAPDGAIIATNNETGARGLINRPGMSGMDALQMLGLGAAFSPAGKVASLGVKTALPGVASATMRKQLEKAAVRKAGYQAAGTMGATEAGLQAGQELAGGSFDPEDVAFTAAAGKVGEHLAKPLANVATKGKELVSQVGEVVPRSVQQALDYAQSTGRKIFTSDALGDFMTPVQQIFLKTVERIPVTGIGRQRIRQKAARTDALIDLVNKYGINVESELGQDIADSFVTRMVRQRFWGKNKEIMDPENWPSPVSNPAGHRKAQAKSQEILENAFSKESDEIIDAALAKQLKQGNLDGEIVETVLDQSNPRRINDLFNKLLPDGQLGVKQRFLTRALNRAGWTPDAPQIADPDGFVKELSKPENRKILKIIFDEGEQDLVEGVREYLRMTSEAAKTGKGAGMVAAVGGSAAVAGALLNGMLGTTAIIAGVGRTIQSKPVRDMLLKLSYAKGDPEKSQRIMQELRPLVVALENQYFEEGGPPQLPEIEFSRDMMKDLGDYGMEYLRSLGDTGMEKVEDVTQSLSNMLN